MFNPLQRFRLFLGPQRFRLFAGLLILTGILSFGLSFIGTTWATTIQTILAVFFVLAAAVIIGGRMDVQQRLTWLAILVPAFGLVALGIGFFPQFQGAFLGGAFGWSLVGLFIFGRSRAPMQYRVAIKAMRKGHYQEAISAMDDLIKVEPDEANHYRFRAELLRLWGKLGRARRDYQSMTARSKSDAEKAVGYNGIAEVELQAGNYNDALRAAQQAFELAPEEWVASYNLGMIADRLGRSAQVIESLTHAMAANVPDARHRLLIYLYLARAHSRLENLESAQECIEKMRREKDGLREWQIILKDEKAATLRAVLAEDVALAEKLLNNELDAAQIAQENGV